MVRHQTRAHERLGGFQIYAALFRHLQRRHAAGQHCARLHTVLEAQVASAQRALGAHFLCGLPAVGGRLRESLSRAYFDMVGAVMACADGALPNAASIAQPATALQLLNIDYCLADLAAICNQVCEYQVQRGKQLSV
jgi:hypothetical protein